MNSLSVCFVLFCCAFECAMLPWCCPQLAMPFVSQQQQQQGLPLTWPVALPPSRASAAAAGVKAETSELRQKAVYVLTPPLCHQPTPSAVSDNVRPVTTNNSIKRQQQQQQQQQQQRQRARGGGGREGGHRDIALTNPTPRHAPLMAPCGIATRISPGRWDDSSARRRTSTHAPALD